MEVKREHLAGLEMALDRWNEGGPSVQFATLLSDLITQAKAVPQEKPIGWAWPGAIEGFKHHLPDWLHVYSDERPDGAVPIYLAPPTPQAVCPAAQFAALLHDLIAQAKAALVESNRQRTEQTDTRAKPMA